MFTGIVEEAGRVETVSVKPESIRVSIKSSFCDVQTGDSIAVNGCCLTVANKPEQNGLLEFDLLRETWSRTNLQFLTTGKQVNLERSLQANGRIHGHFVTGHIDGIAPVEVFEKGGPDWFLTINPPKEILRYIVFKGAIAIDGISLTVAEVGTNHFSVWIIPHTYEITALSERKARDYVNLEVDMLAKYVERFVQR
jgi:riboflavin synthase